MNFPSQLAPAEGPEARRVGRPIRVMVVDDSFVIRSAFSRLIGQEPDLELAAVASSAEEALSLLSSLHVQVILLDLEMPGMGGFEALPKMIERAREAKIMVVSSLTAEGAEQTVRALSLGAADTLLKPQTGGFDMSYREKLLGRIRALGRRPLRRMAPAAQAKVEKPILRAASRAPVEVLAIGASTGGIHAIGQVFGGLPPCLGVPILITQHLPGSFMEAFARQLETLAGRQTVIAEDGLALVNDWIYLAPGHAHMTVIDAADRKQIALVDAPAPSGCMPSVDPMFDSLAGVYGSGVLAVVLTGMGRDGTLGAESIADAGGTIIAQNEATSAVWGMPGSIAKAGLASAILHPSDIAARIITATRSK